MNPLLRRASSAALLCLLALPAGAGATTNAQAEADAPGEAGADAAPPSAAVDDPLLKFSGVRFEGVEGALLENLRRRVSLARLKVGTGLRPSRFRYFLRILPRELDEALQPFGYYSSLLEVVPSRQQDSLSAQVSITLGEPVRVQVKRLEIEGEGGSDPALKAAISRFHPAGNEVLVHPVYEASRSEISRLLGERGYFDSRLDVARVEVSRASATASLDLLWQSGARYRFGDARFSGSPFRQGLLHALVPFRADQPYQQSQLLALQQRLSDLDYFARVEVQPRLREDAAEEVGPPLPRPQAAEPPSIGIDVDLEPAPRNVYRAGLSFGTDTGAGLKFGYTRRWLNERGHRLESDLLLGSERSSALLRYRIPAFERFTGWWTARLAAREEPYFGARADIFEASLLRDGHWRGNLISGGMVLQQEQYNSEGALLVYPQLSVERSVSDDPLYPSRGFKWSLTGRWGLSSMGSEVRFRQLTASARLIRSLGPSTRLLLRGEAGSIRSGQFDRLPPSLRFYAGGDRSVRGYGYQELSPRRDGERQIGGQYLLVGSAEIERMLTAQWGAALFVDAGNAYGDDFEPAVGVGVGLRWRSPVGPIQLDIGRGLDDPDKSFRLHIQLGPPL